MGFKNFIERHQDLIYFLSMVFLTVLVIAIMVIFGIRPVASHSHII